MSSLPLSIVSKFLCMAEILFLIFLLCIGLGSHLCSQSPIVHKIIFNLDSTFVFKSISFTVSVYFAENLVHFSSALSSSIVDIKFLADKSATLSYRLMLNDLIRQMMNCSSSLQKFSLINLNKINF